MNNGNISKDELYNPARLLRIIQELKTDVEQLQEENKQQQTEINQLKESNKIKNGEISKLKDLTQYVTNELKQKDSKE